MLCSIENFSIKFIKHIAVPSSKINNNIHNLVVINLAVPNDTENLCQS